MNSKKIVDIITIVLLACAFGLAFYTGLIGKKGFNEPMLSARTFAMISIIGTLVLLAVGGVSEMIARIKDKTVTWSFTAFLSVQVFSFIGMCAISCALVSGAFDQSNPWIRTLFIVFAVVELLGYAEAVIYAGGAEEGMTPAAESASAAKVEEIVPEEQPEEYEYYYTDEYSDEESAEEFAGESAEDFSDVSSDDFTDEFAGEFTEDGEFDDFEEFDDLDQ